MWRRTSLAGYLRIGEEIWAQNLLEWFFLEQNIWTERRGGEGQTAPSPTAAAAYFITPRSTRHNSGIIGSPDWLTDGTVL